MVRIVAAFVLAWVALLPAKAMAWGANSHVTICEVAYRNLTPVAREQLNEILQTQGAGTVVRGRDGVERRHYRRFNEGCLEEDERPRRHPKDHFVNVSRDLPAIMGDSCPVSASSGSPQSCIFAGLRRDLGILVDRGRTKEDRAFALMAIGHWIGDLHQPLHISFADDAGGNGVAARLQGRCGMSRYHVENMHGLWDNCLPEAGLFERVRQRSDFKRTWSLRTIAYRAADTLMANTDLAEETAYAASEPWQWAAESYAITLAPATAYCGVSGATCASIFHDGASRQIGQDYLSANKAVAEDRIAKAGFRLAHLLNRALDPAYTGPTVNGLQPQ